MGILKLFLYPFAGIYNTVTSVRNYLFDIDYKKSFEFQSNIIGVGNLTVGGTGKTPMVEYLIRLLSDHNKVATLSRGYGRKSKGFRVASENDNAETIGDEPFQIYRKFDNVAVTVGEERAVAIPHILADSNPDVILLDDAFQHRYVKPSLNILLCDYRRPFYKDYIMPLGMLRESRKGAKRADAIVVTKCPKELTENSINEVRKGINEYSSAPIFFAKQEYSAPMSINGDNELGDNVLLFSGLANNASFTEYVSEKFNLADDLYFPDHHSYTAQDLNLIEERFRQIQQENKCIITTEKDYVKLLNSKLFGIVEHWPLFYIPIKTSFIKDGNVFDNMILNSIKTYTD